MIKKLLSTKRLFIVNLILVGMVLGFGLTLLGFSCSSAPPAVAYAQEDRAPGTAMMDLEAMQNSFRSIANQVLPVVVEITVTKITSQQVPPRQGWPFDFFFRDGEDEDTPEGEEREFRSGGLGSGVIVRRDKEKIYVLTNNHVVGEADEIEVILYDERSFPATLVGMDPRKDLALIVFESGDDSIPVAVLGDSDDLYVGDWVLAVGTPLGYISTVTAGIVSALGRHGLQDNINDFIQTDAAINRGNSGGALVNLRGEVIGINTWIATTTGVNAGLGFSIPINNAKKAIDDFISHGEVEYGWLGVSISDVSDDLAEELGITGIKGALIQSVYKNSPANKGGLLPGDYVVSVAGKPVKDYKALTRAVGDLLPKKTYAFDFYRYGKKMTVKLAIGLREKEDIIASDRDLWPGFSLSSLNEDLRQKLKIDKGQKGVVIFVGTRSRAEAVGLKDFDLITAVNGKVVENALDFYRELNAGGGKKTTFTLLRGDVEWEIGIRY